MTTLEAAGRSQRRVRALGIVFYGTLLLLTLAILTQSLAELIGEHWAARIARNSEGILLALLLAAWIEFARPRWLGRPDRALWVAVVTAACVGLWFLLFVTDFPPRFKTLNETFLAAAVLIPYLQLRRPLRAWVPAAVFATALIVILVGQSNSVVILLAEALSALVLFPLALDVVDRGILDPYATTRTSMRVIWYLALAAAPFVLWVLTVQMGTGGYAGEVLGYGMRTFESIGAALLIGLYFAVGLGRTGRQPTEPPAD